MSGKGLRRREGAAPSLLLARAVLVTRAVGLAGFEEAAGNWANPWGSFALMVEGLYLAGYFSIATGVAVAAPEKRDWHS